MRLCLLMVPVVVVVKVTVVALIHILHLNGCYHATRHYTISRWYCYSVGAACWCYKESFCWEGGCVVEDWEEGSYQYGCCCCCNRGYLWSCCQTETVAVVATKTETICVAAPCNFFPVRLSTPWHFDCSRRSQGLLWLFPREREEAVLQALLSLYAAGMQDSVYIIIISSLMNEYPIGDECGMMEEISDMASVEKISQILYWQTLCTVNLSIHFFVIVMRQNLSHQV